MNKHQNQMNNPWAIKYNPNGKITAEHITYCGNMVERSTSQIYSTTVEHFKKFQIPNGEFTSHIDQTPFDCQITIEEGIGIFRLIKANVTLTTNICCFNQNNEKGIELIESMTNTYLKTPIGKIRNRVNGTIIKPKKGYWLFTFIDNIMTLSDALLVGEIEFYIYDAIRRGLNLKNSSVD
jgi:hypothetical protein